MDERQAMLVAVEREKSRAIEELTEQNHKLLGQLQRVRFKSLLTYATYRPKILTNIRIVQMHSTYDVD